jgi:quercetin dioxygenase-like cupin family protein
MDGAKSVAPRPHSCQGRDLRLLAELELWGEPYLLSGFSGRRVEEMHQRSATSSNSERLPRRFDRRPVELAGHVPIDVRLRRERSQGALAVIEAAVAPGSGPPLHAHPSLDETFYVLAGRLTFRVGDAMFTALPGAVVYAERGTPHTYANHSEEPARVLLVSTPGDEAIHYSEIVGPSLRR